MTVDARSWTVSARTGAIAHEAPSLVYGIGLWLALIQVSIAASELVLAGVLALWGYYLWRGEAQLVSLPFDLPITAYASFSIAAALFSFEPAVSFVASKKLLLLLVPYLIVSTVRKPDVLVRLVLVLVAMGDVSALFGLWQYGFGELGGLEHRIHGFMGHYMTYSGQLMATGILALALLLFGGRHRWFLGASLVLIELALTLTLTRSAWIGTVIAVTFLLFAKDRRLPLVLPGLGLAVALLLPHDVERRLGSFLEPDTSGWDRVYMLRAGAHMVANHPLLGVGPDMVAEVYPIYKPTDATQRDNPHLHNNLAQIAAERGLPCLVAWLWLFAVTVVGGVRAYRASASDPRCRALAGGAVAVLAAGFIAGLFEYNFGDSEFQMIFLFVMALPFCLRRETGEPA
jgi:putative inorganic carbon (HCO3(-)) transporter